MWPVAGACSMGFPRVRGGISYKPFVRWGRLAGVKMGLGRLVDADYSRGLRARL